MERSQIIKELRLKKESCVFVAENLKIIEVVDKHFRPTVKVEAPLRLVFYSRISRKKNLHYAINILNGIRDTQIELHIFGTLEDKSYWNECLMLMNSSPNNVSYSYRGELIPEEVVGNLSQYDGFFFPTKGENFGHVIVEAMLAGLPVIISTDTPFSDLQDKGCGWAIPLDREDEFVRVIRQFANVDTEEIGRMKSNIKSFLIEYRLAQSDKIVSYRKIFQ